MKKAAVIDSTAFYAGIPHSSPLRYYTTSLVIHEVTHGDVNTEVISSMIDSGRIVVLEPSKQSLQKTEKSAAESGDSGQISKTDLSVVALGLDLKSEGHEVTIISDDYAVENLASILGMNMAPIMSRGISKTVHWLVYCKGCGKVFKDSSLVECDICGTKLKRKFKRNSKKRIL